MIIYKRNESIFDSTALYLVNPVNTKGVMGSGLAEEFKSRFPDNFDYYHNYCSVSSPVGGDLIWYLPEPAQIIKGDRNIINFCTKERWQNLSKLEWISKGVKRLVDCIEEKYADGKYEVPLLALPLLGCGKGKLKRDDVLDVFTSQFENCKYDVEVYL